MLSRPGFCAGAGAGFAITACTLGQILAAFVDTWRAQDDWRMKVMLKSPFPLLFDVSSKLEANQPTVH